MIHNNGIGATAEVKMLVTARNRTTLAAPKRNQRAN